MNKADIATRKGQLRLCLDWYPFGTDEPHPGDRELSDGLVVSRKEHTCGLCRQPIRVGSITRVRTDVYAGDIATYRWCEECCEAMVACVTGDNWYAMEKRFEIGDEAH